MNAETGRGRRKGARVERTTEGGAGGYGALKLFHSNNYEPELNTAWSDCENSEKSATKSRRVVERRPRGGGGGRRHF
ncbi:hypothetical protein PUN28_007350 [Cardiocondyla obscurior]|uniref:Uncharacterized protein n=1 Tax=Cardiocondyla obscurior TaxID=286306 RepID=A0AAW2G5S4_9HYME